MASMDAPDGTVALLDVCGRRRSPATMPEFRRGKPPRNKGQRYPADPPTTDEVVALLAATRGGDLNGGAAARERWLLGQRSLALIVVLWRSGLRVSEALSLTEHDLDAKIGSILVRRGKGGKSRTVGMDPWAWEQVEPWLYARRQLSIGPLFCVVRGPTRGVRAWDSHSVRHELRRLRERTDVRRRVAPHQFRHAMACEWYREGVPILLISRQLGHAHVGITGIYLQGIPQSELLEAAQSRRAPMVTASAALGRAA